MVLDCQGLVKRFGTRAAVDDVTFSIGPGETFGLLGPNGAGKTTTISMACGLLRPDAGEVHVAGHRMHPLAIEAKAAIGLVPQEIALYPDLTARENLRFFGQLQRISGATLTSRVAEVLEVVGLADRADERVDRYSGGMMRRINIAVGLLHRPQLLVLDEPTVGVDPQSRNAILESVEALAGSGLSVLYTTHYMEEAERLCDRIAIIDAGRIVAEGTRRELVDSLGEGDRIEVTGDGDLDALARAVGSLAGVLRAERLERRVAIQAADGPAVLAAVVAAAQHAGVTISDLAVVQPDLEDVFLQLTGKALRD
ncbi:MAG TPA: ABC transporter ATP-binding protein [Acidimicrobiales bacterium]|nr:ABC transporter ATP-binding protein [Acidimicrobiales bacterium]